MASPGHEGGGEMGRILLTAALLATAAAAQPWPEIMWWHDLDAPSLGSAAAADLDGDGLAEVVFGTYFNDEAIHCLNGEDGSVQWSFVTGGCNDASPVIWDVDCDGDPEVVVPGSSTQTVYCLAGSDGQLEWSSNVGHCIDSPPAVADLDGDGLPEIVHGAFGGWVFCLEGEDGAVAWECSLGTDSYIQTCPDVHDFDGDSLLEVVVAQWQGDCRIYCLDGATGEEEWHSDAPSDWMYHGGSFADVDGDGLPEIAIGCYDSNVYLLNGEDGSTEWTFSAPAYAGGPTSIADMDNDGDLEVFYTAGNTVGTIDHQGGGLWSYTASGSVFRGAAVANIDGDTTPEVIFGTSGGDVVALHGSGGELVWEIDLQSHYGDTYDIDHAPVVTDLDGDGQLDVFVVGGYATSSNPEQNHGRAYALRAGTGTGAGWPMFRYDRFHSAFWEDEGTGVSSPAPAQPPAISVSPNPFTASAAVTVPGRAGSLSVYDLAGRRVRRLAAEDGTAVWNGLGDSGEHLPAGTYLVRLEGGDASAAIRVVLLR